MARFKQAAMQAAYNLKIQHEHVKGFVSFEGLFINGVE